jgi:hypothetical protein
MRHWLAPLPGRHVGCLTCGFKASKLRLSSILGVGCGIVVVTCDDATVWADDSETERLRRFEHMARCLPDTADWRVRFHGPLSDVTYQRQGKNNWVLVKTGKGFA